MIDVLDINHRAINSGDLVLDSRGKVWKIVETENTFRRVRALWGIEQRPVRNGWRDGARLPVYGYAVAVVDSAPKDPREGAWLYARLYADSPERTERQGDMSAMKASSMVAVARVRDRAQGSR